ncbi:MAG: hypothetical protein MUF64_10790 [Polyangiaceae bacterium]|nr:hypothetical protein [Polyangiaceae bacterium]
MAPLLAAGPLRAEQDKASCLDAYERGQEARQAGKLREARGKFAVCAQVSCPGLFVSDCARWGEEVQQVIPTVIFSGVGAAGEETSAIKVYMDGVALAEKVDGRAVEVDPGEHSFVFEHEGVTQKKVLVVRQGERDRLVPISFARASAPRSTPAAEQASGPGSSRGPTAFLVGGIAGLGLGLGMGAWALSLKGKMESGCDAASRFCKDEASRDAAKLGGTVATVSTVGALVGLVSLGTWWFWPSRKPGDAALEASPTVGGGMLRWQGVW